MSWSLARLPDLTGRTFLVTGANSGIGWEAARMFAEKGAQVLLACRNVDKGEAARARLPAGSRAELVQLDLGSLASIRACAAHVKARFGGLDVLVNNAGVMALPRSTTADGFEMQLGTNHLGHFALTGLLLDALRDGGRIVNVSSGAHWVGRIDFDDPMGEKRYSKWGAYAQSKHANMLFTFELERRLAAAGRPVLAVACHPGYAATNLQAVGARMEGSVLGEQGFALGNALFAQSAAAGAWPTVEAAAGESVRSGDFIGPYFFGFGAPKKARASADARDPAPAARLWTWSEEQTGVRFLS